MEETIRLRSAITNAAFGYLLIWVNVYLGPLNLLPAFAGYLLLLAVIVQLHRAEPELAELRVIGVILAAFHAVQWVGQFVGFSLSGRWAVTDLLVGLLTLVFHYRFLTGVASVAQRYQAEDARMDRLVRILRTVQMAAVTAAVIAGAAQPWLPEGVTGVRIALAVMNTAAGLCLMAALFVLARNLPEEGPVTEPDIPGEGRI